MDVFTAFFRADANTANIFNCGILRQSYAHISLQQTFEWGILQPAQPVQYPAMSRKKPENLDFERARDELQAIVEQLEQGDISLEESLKAFERGVALFRNCHKLLAEAEQKVSILSEKSMDAEPEAFDSDHAD